MDDSTPIHVLMRFADGFLSAEDTIKRHMEVLNEHGVVCIGKLGKALGPKPVERINSQCEKGVRSYLFLAQKKRQEYEVHRGRIVGISYSLPHRERKLVPQYYDELAITGQVTVWIKLSSLVKDKGELRHYRIASSKKSTLNALRASMAAIFVIEKGVAITD